MVDEELAGRQAVREQLGGLGICVMQSREVQQSLRKGLIKLVECGPQGLR